MELPSRFFDDLTRLAQDGRHDLACGTCGEGRKKLGSGQWLYPAVMPDGRTQWMLKVLMSNACVNRCGYCAFGAHGVTEPARLKPDELALFFSMLMKERKVGALFLSSAICDRPMRVMDDMLKTASLVRRKYRFRGYLHLKLLPGIGDDQILAAMQLADRVSVNLEAVSPERLRRIAPEKDFDAELVSLLRRVKEIGNNQEVACRGASTQIVVGPSGETDREIVGFMSRCYGDLDLKRVYYSAHSPLPGTPMEHLAPTPLWREHRLYQTDWLLRHYGFTADEIPTDERGSLSPEADPKLMWARLHPEFYPLEVNAAPLESLLRVPGIGPRAAARIVNTRRRQPLSDPADPAAFHVPARRAAPWLLFGGRRRMRIQAQLAFDFDVAEPVVFRDQMP
jgi:predicted DNA-binding helix-hairpin-helix protein